MAKMITVEDETHKALVQLKLDKGYKSIDAIINDKIFRNKIKEAVE